MKGKTLPRQKRTAYRAGIPILVKEPSQDALAAALADALELYDRVARNEAGWSAEDVKKLRRAREVLAFYRGETAGEMAAV